MNSNIVEQLACTKSKYFAKVLNYELNLLI